jgi:succinate dehydrogenase flavin-adding protein (antitoxin of CptAB toxin-antitoxin module)
MTKEIIDMAQECGLIGMRPYIDGIYSEALVAFAKLIAEAEREAFKQIIQQTPFSNWFQADLIEAIDKRGQA